MQLPTCGALLAFVLTASTLTAQPPSAVASNPRAIEFEIAAKDRSDVVAYRLEIFTNGSDTVIGRPVRIVDIPKAASRENGQVRIDLGTALDGLANGSYVATLRVVGRGGESPRSAPTSIFEVTGLADRLSPPAPSLAAPSVQAQTVPSPPPKANEEPRFKLGIVVAVVIAAATIVVLVWR
jgi:hypothetical protein